MASRTLDVASLYADGTTLNAYSFGPYVDNPDGTPPPTATATAVSSGGTVTFTGLADGTRYYAGTGTGGYQYFGFSTPAASVSGASGVTGQAWKANTAYKAGDVVTQAGTAYAANTNFTSGASFSAANWTALGGAADLTPKLDTTVARVDRQGELDFIRSVARARASAEDAAQWIESGADLTAWTAPGTPPIQASGNAFFGVAGAPAQGGIVRAIPGTTVLGAGERMYFAGLLTVPAGGLSAGQVGLGVQYGTAIAAPAADNSDVTLITAPGTGASAPNTGIVSQDKGTRAATAYTTNLTAGTYKLGGFVDEANVSTFLVDATGAVMAWSKVPRAGRSIIGIVAWITDSRALTGMSLSGLVAKRSSQPTFNPRSPTEDFGPTVQWTTHETGASWIVSPPGYDSRKGAPLVLVFHPYNSDETCAWTFTTMRPALRALLKAGYIVAGSTGVPTQDWGAQVASDAAANVYRQIIARRGVTGVAFWAFSMGGLASLNTLAQRVIPCSAWAGGSAVTNLQWTFTNRASKGWDVDVRAAYGLAADGSDYAAKSVGYDPLLRAASDFRGVPMLLVSATGDTTVDKTQNLDLLAAKLAASNPLTVVAGVTSHTDPSNAPSDHIVELFNAALLGGVTQGRVPPSYGLLLRADASTLTGIADGGNVTTLPDVSGNGYDLASGGATPPKYKLSSAANSKPCVVLDGVSTTSLRSTALITGESTRIVIGRLTSTPANPGSFFLITNNTGGSGSRQAVMAFNGNFGSNSGTYLDSGVAQDLAVHVLAGRFKGATGYNGLAGSVVGATRVVGSNGANINSDILINPLTPFELFEVLVYDHLVNDRDMDLICAYATAKWGAATN